MKTATLFLILIHFTTTHAELDQHQKKALKDTQQLLRSKSQRDEAIKNDAQAKEVDAKAGAVAGSPEGKEELYDISAEIMETITKESNGDAAKMQQLLNEAQKNPQSFYNKYFTASQKARIKGIADKSANTAPKH